jgi:thioredoxin-like negative regulator of GroEL
MQAPSSTPYLDEQAPSSNPTSTPAPSPQPPPVAQPATTVGPLSDRTLEAIKEMRGAEQSLQRKDIGGAERSMKRAVQLDPDHPDVAAFATWVLVMAGKKAPSEGIIVLTQTLSRHPECTRAYLFRAKLLKRENKLREAATDFDAVLKRDPDNKEAKSELQLLKLFVRR